MQKKTLTIRLLVCILAIASSTLTFTACKKQTPEEIEAQIRLEVDKAATDAKRFIFEGKQSEAIELLDSQIKLYGERAELCEAMALAYETLGNGELAGTYYFKAAKASKNDEFYLRSASQFEKSQSWASATDSYEQYLAKNPNDLKVWKALAKTLESQNLYEKALNAHFGAIKASGGVPTVESASAIASLYVKQKNYEQAKDWLDGARKNFAQATKEQKTSILADLIVVYNAEKNMPKVVEFYDELNALDSKYAKANFAELQSLIDGYKAQEKAKQDAIKAAEETKARLEKERLAREEAERKADEEAELKAHAELEAKQAEEAKKKAEEDAKLAEIERLRLIELSLTPDERDIKVVNKKLEENDFENAERVAQKMVERDQKSLLAWKTLAKVYSAQNRVQDAYVAARECVRIAPKDVNSELLYLSFAGKILNREDLLDALYLSREKFPTNPEIVLGLARVYVGSENYDEARYNYKLFFQYADKNHPLLKTAQEEFEAIPQVVKKEAKQAIQK